MSQGQEPTAPPTSRDDSRKKVTARKPRTTRANIDLALDDAGPVPQDIKPRSGYENMWIRVMDGSNPAARNMMHAERQGWTPVRPESLDSSYAHMLVQSEKFGGVIGTHDLVLMERPIKYGDQQRAILKQRIVEKTKAVSVGLQNELTGTNINYKDNSSVLNQEVGRRAEFSDDQ